MNNKIKEFLDDVTLSDRGMDLRNDYTISDDQRLMFNLEDFFELIIKECPKFDVKTFWN